MRLTFYVHEVFVHKLRCLFILERLMLHYVTPASHKLSFQSVKKVAFYLLAGAVADTQKNGFVLSNCLVESLFTPRVPIHLYT